MIGKGHKGVFVTLDERKSKLRLALPVSSKKARDVTDAMLSLFVPIKRFVNTITFDNGKEFAYHEEVAKTIQCDTYFAKPYHSWERGQNENASGLLRQYFPKSMELIDVTKEQVLDAVHKLNSRPRKCLGFKTPYEVFEEPVLLIKMIDEGCPTLWNMTIAEDFPYHRTIFAFRQRIVIAVAGT